MCVMIGNIFLDKAFVQQESMFGEKLQYAHEGQKH